MSKLMDPIVGQLMGLRYKSHPWHGVNIGDEAPDKVTCFIEIVSTDTVKYEVDKESGYLFIDRPQKYSNTVPALYGFLPQSYSGELVAQLSNEALQRTDIHGDGDPVDVCVLTEKTITHGDILVHAKPVGGIRMIDHDEADDKIIAVLKHDAVYGNIDDVSQLPPLVVERLRHYFLTYKDLPGAKRNVEITHIYGADEAKEVIRRSMQDYHNRFNNLEALLKL
ncbi:inorganic pyrophosphatase [uncultured Rikenella sp.]|uniref:inorganic pyrophosphatase n=1 Tax=uncultured Rikenella sp. TaxID=368003 RepID=UPI0025F9F000|nr:inorganic pyrophosphatase [uncultured Rikenella sp.]